MKAARRPERREEIERSFRVPKNRMLNVTGTKGEWNINLAVGGTQPPSIISLIPLRLYLTHRTYPRRSRKIGEDDSDPPQKLGGHVAPVAALWNMPLSLPHAGSLSSSFIPAGRLETAPRRGR